ncbi:MAG: helix-hairpin-helix domain-containing protein [Acidobacteriota bacterium]
MGWKIDIKSEEEKRKEIEVEMARLTAGAKSIEVLDDLGEKTLERLKEAGIVTVEQVAGTDPQAILGIAGIGEKTAERIFVAAARYLEEAAARTRAVQEEVAKKKGAASFRRDHAGRARAGRPGAARAGEERRRQEAAGGKRHLDGSHTDLRPRSGHRAPEHRHLPHPERAGDPSGRTCRRSTTT